MAKPYKIPDFRKMYPEASEEYCGSENRRSNDGSKQRRFL